MDINEIDDVKKYMHRFINENQKNFIPNIYIEEILEVKIKDYDDNHGPMGEHYVVRLKQRVPDFSFTTGNKYKVIESQCLVNSRQFNDYVKKNNAIIWI